MRWTDRISLPVLAQGTSRQPIDIFDLLLHTVPLVLLLVRLWRMLAARRAGGSG